MGVVTVTHDNFEQEVLACKIPVVLYFFTQSDTSYEEQLQMTEQLAAQWDGNIKVAKVDINKEVALALRYQIITSPTFIVMYYGLFQTKAVGEQTKENIQKMFPKQE